MALHKPEILHRFNAEVLSKVDTLELALSLEPVARERFFKMLYDGINEHSNLKRATQAGEQIVNLLNPD